MKEEGKNCGLWSADCISCASAALDRYLAAVPAMSLIPLAPLTCDLQIARPHHHASFAVYPAASPHAVLRNGKTEPSTCQRLHDVLLGDGCRVNSEKVRERAAEGNYRKGLNRSRTFND